MAIAAPSAFRYAPTSEVAGNIVGGMLAIWHWVSILAPVVLVIPLVARTRAGRRAWLVLAIVAICLGGLQWGVGSRVVALRRASTVPITSLPKNDPVRRHFGILHGVAFGLMTLQLLAAGTLVTIDSREDA